MARIGVVGLPDGWSTLQLIEAFRSKGCEAHLIDMAGVCVDLDSGSALHGDVDLTSLDAIAVKKVGPVYRPELLNRLALLRFVRDQGVPIFSDPARIERLIDRLSCTVILRSAGIPMPATVATESLSEAIEAVRRFERAVLKPFYTSKARGMKVVEAGPSLSSDLESFRAAGNEMFYVQRMANLDGRDLGLVFLGGDFIGCYARVGSGDSWNTTIRSGGKYELHEPGDDLIDLAHRAQAPFGLDFTCVDVAETAEGPIVFEVSALGGFRGLKEACGIDAAGLYSSYILERISK